MSVVSDDVTRFHGDTLGVVATRSAERVEIRLDGELDMGSCDLLTAVLAAVDLVGVTCITVDLDGLEFVDSTGVLTFLRMRTLQQRSGRRVRFERPRPPVQRVFKTLGIETLLMAPPPAESTRRDEALATANGEPAPGRS